VSERAARVPLVVAGVLAVLSGALVLGVAAWARSRDGGAASPATGPGAALAAVVAAGAPAAAPFAGLTEVRLAVGGPCRRLVVADSDGERGEGLRGRSTAAPYAGMLFAYRADVERRFTMAGVPAPLDIDFYDAAGRRLAGQRMEACQDGDDESCPVYPSGTPFRYALETPAGAGGAATLAPCPQEPRSSSVPG